MASRGRRLVLAGLAVAALVVATLVVASLGRGISWRSSRSEDVLTFPDLDPWGSGGGRVDISAGETEVVEFARWLSLRFRVNVIVPGEHSQSAKSKIIVAHDMIDVTPDLAIALLRENGWRLRRKTFEGAEVYMLEPMK